MSDARIRELRRNLRDVTDLVRLDEELRRVGDGPYELTDKVLVTFVFRSWDGLTYGLNFCLASTRDMRATSVKQDWRRAYDYWLPTSDPIDLATERSRKYL